MPMPQKRHRRRGSLQEEGSSRRRLGEDGESLPGSLLTQPRYYHEIIASRLAELQLPVGDDGSDLAGRSSLPSREILEALTRKSFHDDYSRAALVEYQCQSSSIEPARPDIMGLDTDSGESEPDEQLRLDDDYKRDREVLRSHKTEMDTYTQLDQEQTNQQHIKRAFYLIKAALLLKGVPVEELDAAPLERKYPPQLIMDNTFFFDYVNDDYFGWYFDHHLCYKEFLTDYQRLVLLNDGGDEYTSWRRYRAFYSTPEADRDFLRYWEALVKKIKWIKKYVLIRESSYEWAQIFSKASVQAVRLATEFSHMTMELAGAGLSEFIWNARAYRMFVEDLDGVFYEIWRRVNAGHQLRFKDALKQVYGEKLFPARDLTLKNHLEHGSQLELLFRQCTGGLCKNVPDYRARELIRQEVHWRVGLSGTYAQYARKKLKIAELIGLISSNNIVSA